MSGTDAEWRRNWLLPGRPVVCVDPCSWMTRATYMWRGQVLPVLRGVYTIRRVGVDAETNRPTLWLEEIVNAPRQWSDGYGEFAFAARLFEPIQPPSIEQFRRLCLPRSRFHAEHA